MASEKLGEDYFAEDEPEEKTTPNEQTSDKALEELWFKNHRDLDSLERAHSYLNYALELDGADRAYRERLLRMVVHLGLREDDELFLVLIAVGHARFLMEDLPSKLDRVVDDFRLELDNHRQGFNQMLEESEAKLAQYYQLRFKGVADEQVKAHKKELSEQEQKLINRIADQTTASQYALLRSYEDVADRFEKKVQASVRTASLLQGKDRGLVAFLAVLLLAMGIGLGGVLTLWLQGVTPAQAKDHVASLLQRTD